MQDDEDFIELEQEDDEKGDVFVYKSAEEKPVRPWVSKLIFWAVAAGGIAAGTVLFLSFLALFFYLFVPLLLIASVWTAVQLWRARR